MKTARILFISAASLLVIGGAALFLIGYLSPKPGGLRIETDPKSSVFINGSFVGESPYEGTFKAGKILLRLVPEGSGENLIPYETSIDLVSGVQTVVGRNFAPSEEESFGYVVSFEKTGTKTAGLSIISQPVSAQVLVDGVSRGFSPYNVEAIAPAMHTISIRSPGYSDFTMTIKTLAEYRLVFYAKLAKSDNQGQEANQPLQGEVKKVKILDTPTGYLRVRSQPGESGAEIAQVNPGETFPLLDIDVATGWMEIQYEASKAGLPSGITGWISGKYATISAGVEN